TAPAPPWSRPLSLPAALPISEIRAEIGWVSHETLAYPDLTGQQNLELVARLHGLDPEAAWSEAEERFELGAFARRPVRTCSRGRSEEHTSELQSLTNLVCRLL